MKLGCICFASILLLFFGSLEKSLLAQVQTDKTEQADQVVSIKVMSFNIRYGLAKDGANEWSKRKAMVVETIAKSSPDVLGTQETLDFQATFLADNMPDYTYVGRPRQADGKGEHCGILFRNSRFQKLIEGHFWLSENPDQPGSKSWDSSLPRMATWLKLWDQENKNSLFVLNTHFDHRGKRAREESAKLIAQFVNDLPEDARVIVMGDFNASVDSAPYRALFGGREPLSRLTDTYLSTHPTPEKTDGTFNGFRGTKTGARIDWIGASRSFKVISAEIDRTEFEGRFPSDHFPVNAILK